MAKVDFSQVEFYTETRVLGHTFGALVSGRQVQIDRDGVWAGNGTLARDGADNEMWAIHNCAADLGEAVYDALDGAISRKMNEIIG